MLLVRCICGIRNVNEFFFFTSSQSANKICPNSAVTDFIPTLPATFFDSVCFLPVFLLIDRKLLQIVIRNHSYFVGKFF